MSGAMGRPMIAAPVPRQQRRTRAPNHQAYVHFLPWVLQPIMVAPVLPGETLKRLMFQARVLTTPLLNNQVSGWWFETYWFYVKHRHLLTSPSTYMNGMLDMNASWAAVQHGSASGFFNALTGDTRIFESAYQAVVNEYFRGDGEDHTTAAGIEAGTRNFVRMNLPGWWESIIPDASLTTNMGGIADDSIAGANTALDQLGEVGRALEQWQQLRMLGITNMEYDDWLRSFGVSIAAPMEDRPELLRYSREWQEPSSAVSVDATAQRVSSVVSWKVMERADKDRYFKEPGVVLGLVVCRPKLYHDRAQAGVGMLQSAPAWQTPFATGLYDGYQPVVGLTGYQFDTADLYNVGDQYRYLARGSGPATVAFPADGRIVYPTVSLINSLFVDGANGHVKLDGVTNLAVATAAVGPNASPYTV